jgi:hypothetical protein
MLHTTAVQSGRDLKRSGAFLPISNVAHTDCFQVRHKKLGRAKVQEDFQHKKRWDL